MENENYYICKFKNDSRRGKGILYNKDQNIRYEGQFVNWKLEGKGIYFFENGDYYVGKRKNNLRHGRGIIYYRNGRIKYAGVFLMIKRRIWEIYI